MSLGCHHAGCWKGDSITPPLDWAEMLTGLLRPFGIHVTGVQGYAAGSM